MNGSHKKQTNTCNHKKDYASGPLIKAVFITICTVPPWLIQRLSDASLKNSGIQIYLDNLPSQSAAGAAVMHAISIGVVFGTDGPTMGSRHGHFPLVLSIMMSPQEPGLGFY